MLIDVYRCYNIYYYILHDINTLESLHRYSEITKQLNTIYLNEKNMKTLFKNMLLNKRK